MSGPARVRLGDWTCPSGNRVDVEIVITAGAAAAIIECGWDSPPPLTPADAVHYETVIRPAIIQRASEYTEKLGPSLVVTMP